MKHHEKHPDEVEGCYGCKLTGWQGTTYVGGREQFHNADSIRKQENDHVAELRAKGVDFERAT